MTRTRCWTKKRHTDTTKRKKLWQMIEEPN